MAISLDQQIEELEYELRMRAQVYPRSRKMREGEKALHVARLEAVLKTLRFLKGHEIPAEMPRPADLIAALVHIRQVASNMLGGGAKEAEQIIKVVEDVLTGMVVPKLKEETRTDG